jgi:hypothetical protein
MSREFPGKFLDARRSKAGVFLAMTLIFGSWPGFVLAEGAQLKYSANHWLKSLPTPPGDIDLAELSCPDIRAFPGRIQAVIEQARQLAGEEVAGEALAAELMTRGNMALMREWAEMEQRRLMGATGLNPRERIQAREDLNSLQRELRDALNRLGEGLPGCELDEKRGVDDVECRERHQRTMDARAERAYNNYLEAVQGPLRVMRRELEMLLGQEEAIIHVESRSDAPAMRRYLMHQRIGLLELLRDYARERGNTCVYPDWQRKEASRASNAPE